MKDFYIIIKILDFNSQKLKNFLNILKDILQEIKEDNQVVTLKRNNQTITLEPGNQIELSGSRTLHEVCAESYVF